jgi:tetratricopeptide (TPR) repeat protein
MRRLVRFALALLALAAGAGAAGWWWYRANDPDRLLRRAREALRQGDREEAKQIAASLDGRAPAHAALLRAESLLLQARPFVDANDKAQAAPLLRQALVELRAVDRDGPLRVGHAAVAGQCLYHLGRLRPAERALLFALSEDPDHADVHRALAALYYDQGALDPAVYHLEQVARLDPEDGRPHRLMGLIHKDLEKYPEAIGHYEEALRRNLSGPHEDEARENLADVLVRMSRFEEAGRVLDRLPPQAREKEVPTILRAECLAGEGHSSRLRPFLERALGRYPESSRLLRVQAQALIDEGRPEAAAPFLERAVASAPRDPATRHQLANLYRRLGRTADAKEQDRLAERDRERMKRLSELTQLASANPWSPTIRRDLAEVWRELGVPELEKMWLRAAEACATPPPPPDQPEP